MKLGKHTWKDICDKILHGEGQSITAIGLRNIKVSVIHITQSSLLERVTFELQKSIAFEQEEVVFWI